MMVYESAMNVLTIRQYLGSRSRQHCSILFYVSVYDILSQIVEVLYMVLYGDVFTVFNSWMMISY